MSLTPAAGSRHTDRGYYAELAACQTVFSRGGLCRHGKNPQLSSYAKASMLKTLAKHELFKMAPLVKDMAMLLLSGQMPVGR